MQAGRGLIAIAMLVAGSHAWAVKCESGKKTLYTEAKVCPAGYTDVTHTMDGNFSAVGPSESVRQQEQAFLDGRAAQEAATTAAAQPADPAMYPQTPSKTIQCGTIADRMRGLETDMQQRHSRQSIEQLAQQYRKLREQQVRSQC